MRRGRKTKHTCPALRRFADRVEVLWLPGIEREPPPRYLTLKPRPKWNLSGKKSNDGGRPRLGGFEVTLELFDIDRGTDALVLISS